MAVLGPVHENVFHKTMWKIYKFQDPNNEIARMSKAGVPMEELAMRFAGALIAIEEFEGNLLLNEGINELWTILCSSGGTKFDASHAYIGVGDSATAADATQTGLQASSNKVYVAMDSGYPTYGTSQKARWQATFDGNTANFAWNEITAANGSSDSAKNLNRKVQTMGTKASGTTWIAGLEITLA